MTVEIHDGTHGVFLSRLDDGVLLRMNRTASFIPGATGNIVFYPVTESPLQTTLYAMGRAVVAGGFDFLPGIHDHGPHLGPQTG